MIRHSTALLAAILLAGRAHAQQAHHEDVEIIDAPAFQSADEKKPKLLDATKAIVEKTNEFREKEGKPRVAINAKLSETAAGFADYMAKSGRYGHTADGGNPAARAVKKGYEYCIILENIAYAFDSQGYSTEDLGKTFLEGWKKSPGHRKNMLEPDVTETGVALARSEKTGYYFAVQMFGRPKSLALKFQVTNQSTSIISYKIGDKDFSLPPRYTRTHEQCRPTDLVFALPAEGKTVPQTFKAENGNRFVIAGSEGALRVKKE
ncbi:MAG TPA: CAP domain-containing protein [Urbifossiella sp.]